MRDTREDLFHVRDNCREMALENIVHRQKHAVFLIARVRVRENMLGVEKPKRFGGRVIGKCNRSAWLPRDDINMPLAARTVRMRSGVAIRTPNRRSSISLCSGNSSVDALLNTLGIETSADYISLQGLTCATSSAPWEPSLEMLPDIAL